MVVFWKVWKWEKIPPNTLIVEKRRKGKLWDKCSDFGQKKVLSFFGKYGNGKKSLQIH